MSDLRLLQVMAGAAQGGAEGFFTRLIPALARVGIEQHVVMRRDPEREAALQRAGLNPVALRFGGPLDLATPLALRREIGRFQPQVVLSWMNRATDAVPSRGAIRRGFVHVARLGGYYQPKYYRRADFLVGNTQGIVGWLKELGHWPTERIRYLPNFVEAGRAAPLPRSRFQTPSGVPLLLCLGRLHRNKAFDVAVRALRQLPTAYLWLAGDGPERPALQRLMGELGVGERVRWLGWRDDVPSVLATADLLLCPSRIEPLGNVVIEAWAHYLPVVAAESAGPAELIVDGETGLLTAIEDDQALAAAARRVIGDRALRARLVVRARQTFETTYSEAAVVRQYGDFLREAAACVASRG